MACAFINKMKCIGATDVDLGILYAGVDANAIIKRTVLNKQKDKVYIEVAIWDITKVIEINLAKSTRTLNNYSRPLKWDSRIYEEFCVISINYFGNYTLITDKNMNMQIMEGAHGSCRRLRLVKGGSFLNFNAVFDGRYIEYYFMNGKIYNRGFTRGANKQCVEYIDEKDIRQKCILSTEVKQPAYIKIREDSVG